MWQGFQSPFTGKIWDQKPVRAHSLDTVALQDGLLETSLCKAIPQKPLLPPRVLPTESWWIERWSAPPLIRSKWPGHAGMELTWHFFPKDAVLRTVIETGSQALPQT